MAGSKVRVRKESRGSSKTLKRKAGESTLLVGRGRELPEELVPAVILDACGRVRQTYKFWAEERGSLVRLKPAVRDYGKLTVHVWDRGAGRSTIYDNTVYPRVVSTLQTTITKHQSSD